MGELLGEPLLGMLRSTNWKAGAGGPLSLGI